MTNELMRPLDPETARAVEELAKTGGKIVDAGMKAGGYVDRVLGRLPDNIVGLLVGDWVLHQRVRRWAKLQEETAAILSGKGVNEPFAEISPSIAVPLIESAVNEDREHLRALWAQLLASALNPATSGKVRLSFIAALKQFDPLDARALRELNGRRSGQLPSAWPNYLAEQLRVPFDEVHISIQNLVRLGCILDSTLTSAINNPMLPFGRELMRACGE